MDAPISSAISHPTKERETRKDEAQFFEFEIRASDSPWRAVDFVTKGIF
jgi:hypothetical protein